MNIGAVCAEIRNYFDYKTSRHFGTFKIKDGALEGAGDYLKDGQYFRIVGSALNDGVYQHPCTSLIDEEFEGAVWEMAVPLDFLAVCEEIETFNNSPQAVNSPYTSESFGGYSYSKASTASGAGATWKEVFATRLNNWRKI